MPALGLLNNELKVLQSKEWLGNNNIYTHIYMCVEYSGERYAGFISQGTTKQTKREEKRNWEIWGRYKVGVRNLRTPGGGPKPSTL